MAPARVSATASTISPSWRQECVTETWSSCLPAPAVPVVMLVRTGMGFSRTAAAVPAPHQALPKKRESVLDRSGRGIFWLLLATEGRLDVGRRSQRGFGERRVVDWGSGAGNQVEVMSPIVALSLVLLTKKKKHDRLSGCGSCPAVSVVVHPVKTENNLHGMGPLLSLAHLDDAPTGSLCSQTQPVA